ncbi:hypothetical protein ACS0TY_022693 [Phlomoides rotata]
MAQKLWDVWNLRCAVLMSLMLQVVLTALANSRKTRRNRLELTATIWVAYLLADWIAAFAVGLISRSQTNDCPEKNAVNNQLAAFWAPFLLLHLGGPDAITAFSLEDNELWIRHLFELLIQLAAVVYVFIQSLPNDYWIPTALMFFAGVIKYAERTLSLYRACLGNFKRSLLEDPNPGPNYAQFMEEYTALKASHVPVEIKIEKEPEKADFAAAGMIQTDQTQNTMHVDSLEYTNILVDGYNFFRVFKGLVVDHMFSFHERNESRKFFFSNKAVDVFFKVMEVELNLMYDSLYTKYGSVHCKIGYICRFLCTALTVMSFQQFASRSQHNIFLVDKIVTYILLCGAVCLDLVGMYNLVISDWSIVLAKGAVSSILIRLPFCKRTRRWSENLYQHSFFRFCLNQRAEWLNNVADFIGIKATLDEFKYKENYKWDGNLRKFIFEQLKEKAEKAQTTESVKEIYSARGEWVLLDYPSHYGYPSISSSLSDEVEYDESLLLWHIATEMCYFTSSSDDPNRKLCKVLSDYMLYLLVLKPTMMSAVAGIAQVRFQDTCEEAKILFKQWETELSSASADQLEKLACKKLMDVKTDVKPKLVKGDRSKSLLFDACILANDLNKLDKVMHEEGRWRMMCRIWVELLSYAAGHCRPDVHARQLSQGGELIAFVWLLMVHFGLGEQFRVEAGHARAKLLVST